MKRIPIAPDGKYVRIEAILEAPIWALLAAIVLMTIAVAATVIAQL